MIELSAVSTSNQRRRLLIGVPFLLLVVLSLPLLLLLVPVIFIACLAVRVNPFEALAVLWRVLTALRGTHVEVTGSDRSVLVQLF